MELEMLSALVLIQLICIVSGKVVIIPDTKLEDCGEENSKANYFDFSTFELIPVDDEHVVMNGTWKILKEVKSPWRAHMKAEKYIRGEWLTQAFDRTYDDFCGPLHGINEPWYYAFENREACPIPAGTNWFFDMMPIKFPETLLHAIPPHYMGRWRFMIAGEFNEESGIVKDCKRIYADIFED